MTTNVKHSQRFCPVKEQTVARRFRIHEDACPHCGVPLPAKHWDVWIEVDDDGSIRSVGDWRNPSSTRGLREFTKGAGSGLGVLALSLVGAVVATFVLGFFPDVDPSLRGGFSFVVFVLIATLLIRRATKN